MTGPSHILAIDPGLAGALALLNCQTKAIEFIADMPVTEGRVDPAKLADLVDFCKTRGSIHAAVELISALPRQAGGSNFAISAGVIHGVLGALRVPYSLIPSAQWKPACGLRRLPNESQQQNKTRGRELATRLWPGRAADFAKVKFDGRAEACLLARYYLNKEGFK
jgi:crossover junction endodeoxyribonuclease RuvC